MKSGLQVALRRGGESRAPEGGLAAKGAEERDPIGASLRHIPYPEAPM